MADLSINFAGIKSPNPFWLASAPPTNSAYQVNKAFEQGWGGAVWKTIGTPVLNVSSRYGGFEYNGNKLVAINNIELISDRPLEVNLREIAEVKKLWPDRAVIVSAMFEGDPEVWKDAIKRIEDTGADGIELNYGCPHGMSERGMGSAVGQVPEYCEMITQWVTSVANIPVIVKLTPNVTDMKPPARAAIAAKANGLALINTINSVIGVDLDSFQLKPNVAGLGGHGGYAGPAVKPIALSFLSEVMQLEETRDYRVPISGMGGIQTWRDAAEFLLLGATSLQVCTAVMHYGFRIIDDLTDGLSNWLDEKGAKSINDIIGASAPKYSSFNNLDLSYKVIADIDHDKCINCDLCYISCDEGAHQSIDLLVDGQVIDLKTYTGSVKPKPIINTDTCVGCNLCSLVCPVDGCISMLEVESGREHTTWGEITEKLPEVTLKWDQMAAYRKKHNIDIH
ncbi:MAG TPA: NAD-dependent dihydropyrimidine dehydrogenase subunit PreA [Trueperaceae bacterium]|nr:NAD-dependent dihydropyrimidine dehydrogenase subunit PreA [Trueperaceae bacterium]